MPLSWEGISSFALNTLSAEERKGSAAYLDERVLQSGSEIEIDHDKVWIPSPAAMVFVDLEPCANWGHDCRYLFVDIESGSIQSYPARFPPYLRGAAPTLRNVWKGEDVPSWALAC